MDPGAHLGTLEGFGQIIIGPGLHALLNIVVPGNYLNVFAQRLHRLVIFLGAISTKLVRHVGCKPVL